MTLCYLGLGGNVGPVEETLKQAYRLLTTDGIHLVATSTVLETPAVGKDAGAPFRNAAATIETDLSPTDLLKRLNAIEAELGRERIVHWGPRTLDIDLLLYGDQIVDLPELTVPHSACWYRSFVLTPLAEIAGDVIHPVKKVSIRELSRRIQTRPLAIQVAGNDQRQCEDLVRHLSDSFRESTEVSVWQPHHEPPDSQSIADELATLAPVGGVSEQPINLQGRCIPSAIIELVPEAFARENAVIPLAVIGQAVYMAMSTPNIAMKDKIEDTLNCEVQIAVCSERDIQHAIDQHYGNVVAVSPATPEPALLFWCGGEPNGFEALPIVPRLDISTGPRSPLESAAYAIQSAIG
ncbi:UNVERIFIED_CONTAM: hypothetical protein GTU68_039089 [Idotea baltica]|nr:hypothetical protein [Idotea baltica]